jgi:cell division protein FtsB
MRIIAAILFILVLALQYRLWASDDGVREVWRLRDEIAAQRAENEQLKERNRTLIAEVQDLKQGKTAIEERARTDLGMIRDNESFYQVMESKPAKRADTPVDGDAH